MKWKKLAAVLLASAMALALASPVFAAKVLGKDSDGNGFVVYYDDGSELHFNARGDSYRFYDPYGNDIEIDPEEVDRYGYTQIANMYNGSGSSSKSSSKSSSSSKNSKYAGSSLTDAYWDYSKGKAVAKWEADNRSKADYTVTLYRDDKKVTSKTSSGGSSINFTDTIASHNKTGDYRFTVKAKWPGKYDDTMDSEEIYIDSSDLRDIKNKSSNSSGSSSSSSSNSYTTSSSGPYSGAGPAGGSPANYGWRQEGSYWRYLRQDGSYSAGCWELINGKWYCFDRNGIMYANTWIKSQTNEHIWYYVGPDGDMLTNTYIGQWYVNENGECWY